MNPLDRMRKIRRTILKTINDIRAGPKVNAPPLQMDFHGNKAATEYALHLLENPEDQEKCDEICKANNLGAVG